MALKIVELTKDNEDKYLQQTADLEQKVLHSMEANGQVGQLFITGKDDISEYAHSKENTVLLAVDDNDKVLAASYITQGQKPFTYNDITKYFKYGEKYQEYVKSLYRTEKDFEKDMLTTYKIKIEAFKYAKKKILEQYPQYEGDILKFLEHELQEEHNHFHEKSELRELLNAYMSEYVHEKSAQNPGLEQRYEMFYWITADDIFKELGKNGTNQNQESNSLDKYIKWQKDDIEYLKLLHEGKLVIYEKPTFNVEKYYSANTGNSIELDTYITDPDARQAGLSRILVLAGIEKHMKEHFGKKSDNDIFLCSTLHRDNLSSKYVSEFFGLTDSLYVKRRDGRNREVHICRVKREDYKKYLENMKKKIAVLYGYNPEHLPVSQEETADILREQLAYDENELMRIKYVKKLNGKTYKGSIDYENSKANKVKKLRKRLLETLKEKSTDNRDVPE